MQTPKEGKREIDVLENLEIEIEKKKDLNKLNKIIADLVF